ncbi:MAG: hypothetical protein J7L80_01630 [Thermoplasmata archaeon]|mgnify:CR=1 FL=1|nr:hypothetical protein [Thermoplasmata archaeon]
MNKKGVLELPMQYIVAILVAGIAISLMSMAAYNLWKDYEVKKAIKEVNRIVDEAELIYMTGDENTYVTLDINLPNSVKEIVFCSSIEGLINRYYIIMKWGENKSFIAKNVKFYGKTVLYSTTKKVSLELIEENGDKYVKISPQ